MKYYVCIVVHTYILMIAYKWYTCAHDACYDKLYNVKMIVLVHNEKGLVDHWFIVTQVVKGLGGSLVHRVPNDKKGLGG